MGLHLAISLVSINEKVEGEEEISEGDGDGDEDTECEELHMIRLVWAKAKVAG